MNRLILTVPLGESLHVGPAVILLDRLKSHQGAVRLVCSVPDYLNVTRSNAKRKRPPGGPYALEERVTIAVPDPDTPLGTSKTIWARVNPEVGVRLFRDLEEIVGIAEAAFLDSDSDIWHHRIVDVLTGEVAWPTDDESE